MLSSDPHEAGENHRAFWNAMKPMSIDLIEQYYDHYTPEPLFDCENREYAEWSDNVGRLYYGTRNKKT